VKKNLSKKTISKPPSEEYGGLIGGIAELLEAARRTAARTVNALMTATYWEIGRRIVEFEQGGKSKAQYGEEVIDQLASDLTGRFGRGFTRSNLFSMRAFYAANARIVQTVSGQLQLPEKIQTASGKCAPAMRKSPVPTLQPPAELIATLANAFPLPWSAYVRLLSVTSEQARRFYETEALRGGWSVRQLDRQIEHSCGRPPLSRLGRRIPAMLALPPSNRLLPLYERAPSVSRIDITAPAYSAQN